MEGTWRPPPQAPAAELLPAARKAHARCRRHERQTPRARHALTRPGRRPPAPRGIGTAASSERRGSPPEPRACPHPAITAYCERTSIHTALDPPCRPAQPAPPTRLPYRSSLFPFAPPWRGLPPGCKPGAVRQSASNLWESGSGLATDRPSSLLSPEGWIVATLARLSKGFLNSFCRRAAHRMLTSFAWSACRNTSASGARRAVPRPGLATVVENVSLNLRSGASHY